MVVTNMCRCCKRYFCIEVDAIGYMDWQNGDKLIQQALPHNTSAERELLLSQTCAECFNYIFSEED